MFLSNDLQTKYNKLLWLLDLYNEQTPSYCVILLN